MRSFWSGTAIRRTAAAICALLIALPASFAQAPADPTQAAPDTQQVVPLLPPDQLNNLVAPIALYPDPLLGQVLAASTYPLEIVEAHQWLQRNRNLQGAQLMDAAKRQRWDPSVQAMVAFPDALALLANDVRWTTELGNAFLAQQADVMSAVQRMRAQAKANGKLTTTPQQVVTTNTQDGQNAIVIQPADPQVVYVPIYSPAYVWGPPAWGAYPDLWYPPGFGFGFGFGRGIYMGFYFPSWIGWGGWGGWGWGCGWYGRGLYLNTGFFNRYGYGGGYYGRGGYYGGGGYYGHGYGGGQAAWAHNPSHRMGVPYSNRNLANQFGGGRMNNGQFAGNTRAGGSQWNGPRNDAGRQGTAQFNGTGTGGFNGTRSATAGGWQSFGNGNRTTSAAQADARGFAQSGNSGFRSNSNSTTGSYRQPAQNYAGNGGSMNGGAPAQSTRGFGTAQGSQNWRSTGGSSSARSYSAPNQSFSNPQSSSGWRGTGGGGYSASRSYSAPSQSFSGPQSFSGSRGSGGGGFSAPRSYSAPSQSFSAPRGSGGGSGFSGGRSGGGGAGFSGGRSGGGGGGGHRR
jgi:hypothetical protein